MCPEIEDEQGAFIEEGELGEEAAKARLYIDDAEFVLIPLLATDPLPYVVDQDGNWIDAKGRRAADPDARRVSAPIRKLQARISPKRRRRGRPRLR